MSITISFQNTNIPFKSLIKRLSLSPLTFQNFLQCQANNHYWVAPFGMSQFFPEQFSTSKQEWEEKAKPKGVATSPFVTFQTVNHHLDLTKTVLHVSYLLGVAHPDNLERRDAFRLGPL
ncbi:hypothetical protein PAAG_11737 [Paracoccidioides lutzii Pb01]|uniref:Uncharacterized protein n=1 Tax=Paracoccidioides lutzii (strain ATCC MYA-826 / Pb01) TaxID=502779 RepID=A0A0A2V560_PARBA|nr:hypothetical protein PAAG_11737 [Paracoccidioides lutzii Pb01]KGQ01502.1 hypothetical protein PAAG_11737 [Paracoccidioides lutzii Pb01]